LHFRIVDASVLRRPRQRVALLDRDLIFRVALISVRVLPGLPLLHRRLLARICGDAVHLGVGLALQPFRLMSIVLRGIRQRDNASVCDHSPVALFGGAHCTHVIA
jgi:hypothetical protein